jgi:hypothetical protein
VQGQFANIICRLLSHFFMGVALGLAFLIVVITANLANISDMLSSPINSMQSALPLMLYVATTFGMGATITGAVFEAVQRPH